MPNESSGAGFLYSQESHALPIPGGAAQANGILSLPQGRRMTIRSVKVVVTVVGAGAGANRTINVRRGNATGPIVATGVLTLANTAAAGAVIDIPVTGGSADYLDANDLTIEFPAAGAVAFTAGAILVVLGIRQRMQQRN